MLVARNVRRLGQYLVYGPKLWHYHLPIRHASPDNPFFMPWAYGLYWGVHAILVLRLAELLSRRTGWKRGWSIVVLSPLVGYAWDIVVEGMATHFGWWSYQTPLGPYFDAGRGLQPLVIPIVIMFGWPNLVAWLAGDPADREPDYIERLFRIHRLRARLTPSGPDLAACAEPTSPAPGGTLILLQSGLATTATTAARRFEWKLELARLAAWIVVFQVSFVLLLDVPLIVLRMTIGHPSSYIP